MTPLIAPSLLSANFANLAGDVARLEAAGADWLHFDVMDGHFVPNLTMGPAVLEAVRDLTRLPIDVHLMVEEPSWLLPMMASAGADRITVHYEAVTHLERTLSAIRDLGCRSGLAFNPGTPLALEPSVLDVLDLVLVMTVNPGFPAQRFIRGALPKVEEAAALVAGRSGIEIEVDGGVDQVTGPECHRRGATVLVAGNFVFRHPDGPAAAVTQLRG